MYNALTKPPIKQRKVTLSEHTEQILETRQKAIEEEDIDKYEQLTKDFRKNKDKDKRENIPKTIEQDLDVREKWLGIRQLKNKFTPHPYSRIDHDSGEHIHRNNRAQKAADYLTNKQWGHEDTKENRESRRNKQLTSNIINRNTEQYNIGEITTPELKNIIRKLKRNKAPGPDEIPTELFKELNEENLEYILGGNT